MRPYDQDAVRRAVSDTIRPIVGENVDFILSMRNGSVPPLGYIGYEQVAATTPEWSIDRLLAELAEEV